MNQLLVVLPCCEKDVDTAIKLMGWINDKDENTRHISRPRSILLAADSAVPLEKCKELKALAQLSFKYVETTTVRVAAKDWRAPNEMFHAVAGFVKSNFKMPFFWMEPDCVPIFPSWLTDLTEAYFDTPRRYMGALVECKDEGLPPLHLAGCAVYPNDAIDLLDKHCGPKTESAWDISSAKDVVGSQKAAETGLIQSFYGEKDLPPSFVRQKVQGTAYAANVLDVSFLNERAVIFHRCKDGSLIDVLRELRTEQLPAKNPSIDPVPAGLPTKTVDPIAEKPGAHPTQSERMKEIWAKRKEAKRTASALP
jgi:hypothetical protein